MSRLYVFNGKLIVEFERDDFTPAELDAIGEWKDAVPEANALDQPATGGGGTGEDA